MRYYNLNRILEFEATYNMIIGERSNGKTYAVLNYILENYIKHGEKGAVVRRYQDDFRKKRGARLFTPLVEKKVIEKFTKGKYNTVEYDGSQWFLGKIYTDDKGREKVDKCPDAFCYSYSISAQEHDKGFSIPTITTILFDEFISRTGYLPDEFILFTNTLSSVIRERGNVKIFMLGNTVNKYCPYFDEMGLKHVPNMKQGSIDIYHYGESNLTVAVEFCEKSNQSKPSDKYFAFDNPKLQMITNGVWEISIYPKAPRKIKPMDIVFTYFIKFGQDLLQCDIINQEDIDYTFIHYKTTPLKNEDEEIIYSLEYNALPNYRRNIRKPIDEIDRKIALYFLKNKVFYQSNEIGEIVRNYLEQCKII